MSEMRAFLRDLARLTKKHKIAIWGCGDCGSPTLYDSSTKRETTLMENLYWCRKCQEYGVRQEHYHGML